MNRVRLAVVTAAVLLGALGWYLFRPRPLTPQQLIGASVFHRPQELSPRGGEFSLRINGVDALTDTVVVTCGEPISCTVTLPPHFIRDVTPVRTLILVPRAPHGDDSDFEFIDVYSDRLVTCKYRGPRSPEGDHRHPVIEPFQWSIHPGEYRVRYYLQDSYYSPDRDPVIQTEWLGSGRLIVEPSKTGADKGCDYVPLSKKKDLIPVQYPPTPK
jgi:hypothetical protein